MVSSLEVEEALLFYLGYFQQILEVEAVASLVEEAGILEGA